MSRGPVFAVGATMGLLGVITSAALRGSPAVVWNTTASAPTGLYRTTPERQPLVGDPVFIRAPAPVAARLAATGFLPQGALLLKQIAGVAPSIVCRAGALVTVDGRPAARALDRDRFGRPLPVWSGCRHLAAGEVFLLNQEPHSLDSRYFGALPASGIVGRATPLWLFRTGAHAR